MNPKTASLGRSRWDPNTDFDRAAELDPTGNTVSESVTETRDEIQPLAALEALAGVRRDMEDLEQKLAAVPLWTPGHALRKLGGTLSARIDYLEDRLDQKLVVTLIGPCGAGKSTLLNALIGRDDGVPVGTTRPTTREVTAVCADSRDARQVRQVLGEQVAVHTLAAAPALKDIVLIDTPDTDSTAREAHLALIRQAVKVSDVLLCIFNAENPKTRDHADLMAPLTALFNGDALMAVLNRCDRLDADELKDTIQPEFEDYLRQAWEKSPGYIFCLSGRRHLQAPGWVPGAEPRHDFDQFQELLAALAGAVSSPDRVVHRRVAAARELQYYFRQAVQERLAAARPHLHQARQALQVAEHRALGEALLGFRGSDMETLPGINLQLYQSLAHRWIGPMGGVIALWARLMVFGMGMLALLRFGRPLSQAMGLIRSLRHLNLSREQLAAAGDQERVRRALGRYKSALLTTWPDIAEMLIRAGLNPSVRQPGEVIPDAQTLDGELARAWQETLEEQIDTAARRLSHGSLQLLFNLPGVAIFGHMAWLTIREYLRGQYLSGDFFLHSVFTLLIVLAGSFFLFQMLARVIASASRLSKQAFSAIQTKIETLPAVTANPVVEQVDRLLALADEVG